jgi:N-acetylglucosamine-6-sulfatase
MPHRLLRAMGALAIAALCSWTFAPRANADAWASAQAQSSSRPNVIVVMTDDLDVGSMDRLEQLGRAPHIKAHVIDRGTRFTNAFVTNSLCCPSRATFLTGQYPHNHGALKNIPEEGILAFDDRNTLAVWLQNTGYTTSFIGKYLNRYGTSDVTGDGTVDDDDRRYVPPGWDDWQVLLDPSTYGVYNYRINDNGQFVTYGANAADYQTDVLAARAAAFIRNAAGTGSPFFLVVMPLAPHVEVFWWSFLQTPWQWSIRPAPRHFFTLPVSLPRPPSFNEADVSDKPAWVQEYRPRMTAFDTWAVTQQYRRRLESLRSVDDLVGQVVAALQDTGELDNTAIIFTSDNGYLHGEHRMPQKLVAYEESIRVPLMVRLPGGSPSVVDHVVINNDLAPMIAELTGAIPSLPIDGTSFLPLLRESVTQWRRRFLVRHWQTVADLRWDVPSFTAIRSEEPVMRRGDVLYVEYDDPAQTPEFYDMRIDPWQMDSLHATMNPARLQQIQQLRVWASQLSTCQGEGCRALEFGP